MTPAVPPSSRGGFRRNFWLRTLFFAGVAACVLVLVVDLPRNQSIVVDLPRGPEAAEISQLEMTWTTTGDAADVDGQQAGGDPLGGTIWTFPACAPRQVRTDLTIPDGHYWLTFSWSSPGPEGSVSATDTHQVELAGEGVHVYLKAASP